MEFLTIDPGQHPGWCVVDNQLRITGCGINAPPKHKFSIVLAERPTVYPNSKSRPEDQITLAITLGKMLRPYEDLGCKIVLVEPRSWKGQIPKDKHHAAIRRTLPANEMTVVDNCLKGVSEKFCEDAMDAVGLADYGRKMRIFR